MALGARNAVLIHRVSSRAIARRYTVRQVHTQPTVKFRFSKKAANSFRNLPLDLKHYRNSNESFTILFLGKSGRFGHTKNSAIMLKYPTFEAVSCFHRQKNVSLHVGSALKSFFKRYTR